MKQENIKDPGDSIIKLKRVTLLNQLNKLSGSIDNTNDWTISPASVEVNYDALTNSLTIPGASLHQLYFHPLQPDYINYAGIGISIAKAFIRVLSPTSLQFDETGYSIVTKFPATFWTDLHSKSQCYINQYISWYKLKKENTDEDEENVDQEKVTKIASRANRTLNEILVDVQAFQLIYESLENITADVDTRESEHLMMHFIQFKHVNVTLSIHQLFIVLYESNFCQSSTLDWLHLEEFISFSLPARERGDLSLINSVNLLDTLNCSISSHLVYEQSKLDKCSIW